MQRIMYDETIKLGKSKINHGKYNNRIYLMKLSEDDCPGIITELNDIACKHGYTKIIAKVPGFAKAYFDNNDYVLEASIPEFYNGRDDVYFMSKFFNEDRRSSDRIEKIENVMDTTNDKETLESRPLLEDGFRWKMCSKEDAEEMSEIYRKVFETYPSPIHEPDYIEKTMDDNVIYFGIYNNNRLAALASSEMDERSQNAEMTDFATLPDYRGKGFAVYLLYRMEKEMEKRGIKAAYAMARAVSFGMNITFSKLGYQYGGTLINNTNISGDLESMNIWYKYL